MTKETAVKILKKYPLDWFEYELEDGQMGDCSHSIRFPTLFDSKKEAQEVAVAIRTLIRDIGVK